MRFRTWLIALSFLCVFAFAQDKQIMQQMSPAAKNVVKTLDSLNALPANEWRFHAGDVPHGEAADLDDSSWQVVQQGYKGPNDAVWFRRVIEIPKTLNGYDLTGATVSFHFVAYANGPMPEIIYVNGRRVAMGDDLEPIILFENAKPGERALVAVKLLHTVDAKNFARAELKITFVPTRPNPDDLRRELLSTAVLLPQNANTVDQAAAAVALQALSAADQSKFDASLRNAETALAALRPEIKRYTAHISGNSHIDAAWLWPWTETVDVVKRTFSTALQLMHEYPDYTYTQSAAAYNEWMAQKYPSINDEIKQRIREHRWEVVGGMWVEPDLNMPDGESLVRQLLIGKRYFREQYGADVRIGWNPDSFGYNWQLPQIYKKSGVDYFVTQKMTWNDTNKLPLKLFWWQSPDGSKVLAYFPHDYANDNLDPVRLSADLATAAKQAPGMNDMMDLYGIGDHGGGPTRSTLDQGKHWTDANKTVPKYQWGITQPWFSSVEARLAPNSPTWNYKSLASGNTTLPAPNGNQISIPTWRDELYFEYHRGVFTTQAQHKRNMRESEEWLLNAEKYAAFAWANGKPYPHSELNQAWKHVLFNQFHDLAAGSGIAVIYKDAQQDYNAVHWAANDITSSSLADLASRVNTNVAAGVPLLIANPLAWQRSGTVEATVQLPESANSVSVLDSRGTPVPFTASDPDSTHSLHLTLLARDIPSLGYETYSVVPDSRPFQSDLRVSGTTLENTNLRVTIDPQTGCITSLYDKRAQFESIASGACGNQLIAFADNPKDYDAWNIDADFEDHPTPLTRAESVTVTENSPFRAVVRVLHRYQQSTFTQDLVLYPNSDQLDVVNDFDWHETHVLLKAAFPLNIQSDHATYEIPYGTIARPTTRNNSFEKAMFEVPALRWADISDSQHGLSLINESKYGYDAKSNVLRISLLRSPTWPDPDADRGHHHFRYSLYPHAGDWKQALSIRRGYEYNYPLTARQVAPHTGSLPSRGSLLAVSNTNFVVTAIKKAEDSDAILVRGFEWAGVPSDIRLRMNTPLRSASITNLMESDSASATSNNGEVQFHANPYEIVTIKLNVK